MYDVENLLDNKNVKIVEEKGPFTVLEYQQDLSVTPDSALRAYFAARMNVRRRQVVCDLDTAPVTAQAGAMQWMLGDVEMATGVKGPGDLARKAVRGAGSRESVIKPEYTGSGVLCLEPTWKHILLENVEDWGRGMVLEDGLFLACDSRLQQKLTARRSFSSAAAGGEGLFNLSLQGRGIVCLESDVPRDELVLVKLKDDEIRIDGHFAIAWSLGLSFTVERSGQTLIGSAASGEGLVNVYRGTGQVLMAPIL